MLSKIRNFVNFNILKSIYHAILESHLNYSLTVWAQNANSIKRLLVLQKKSLRIMHFLKRNAHTSNLFKNLNILKLPDKVSLENCILICKYFNQSLPKSFKNWLQSFFNKVAILRACGFIEGGLQHGCFTVGFVKFLSAPFLMSIWQLLIL